MFDIITHLFINRKKTKGEKEDEQKRIRKRGTKEKDKKR